MRNSMIHLALIGAALCAFAPAQSVSQSGRHSSKFGNSYLGGYTRARAGLSATKSSTTQQAAAYVSVSGDARFLRQIKRVFLFNAGCSAYHRGSTNRYSASATGYVGRTRILSKRTRSSGTFSPGRIYRRMNLFPITPSVTITIYGVPVTVKGNIGVGISASASLSLSRARARVSATGQGWGYGWADGYAGWSRFRAGCEGRVRVANQILRASAYADARYRPRVGGSVDYSIRPLELSLKPYLQAWKKFSTTLVSWKSREIRIANLLRL